MNGYISDEVVFGIRTDQVLKYAVTVTDGVDELSAEFSDNQILLMLPETAALKWYDSEELGIENTVEIDGDNRLHLLIEKDLPCVGRPDDPDLEDAFPRPAESPEKVS